MGRIGRFLEGCRRDPTRLSYRKMPCVFGDEVERGNGKMLEVIWGMYPEGCADWGTLNLLAVGACNSSWSACSALPRSSWPAKGVQPGTTWLKTRTSKS